MQPRLPRADDAYGEKRIVYSCRIPTFEAPVRRRVDRVAEQPLGDATVEGRCLGFGARKATIVFGDAGPLVEEGLPVDRVPSLDGLPESQEGALENTHDGTLVLAQHVEDVSRGLAGGGKDQRFSIEPNLDS